ncbi:MAG: hypothetical protein AAFY81_08985, partial [Pseudomonadota bacterium]
APIPGEPTSAPAATGQRTGTVFTIPIYCPEDPGNFSLSSAMRFGWRLVFIDEARSISADYLRNTSKRPVLARLNVAAERFVNTLEKVVDEIDQEKPCKRYHLRLLSVPSIGWNGIWLATKDGSSDKIYTGEGKQISEDVLIKTITELAKSGVALTDAYSRVTPCE